MAVKTSWAAGDVLTAADLTDTFAAKASKVGSILQVVASTYSTQTNTSSSTWADLGLSATITPSSSSSKILILVHHAGVGKGTSNTGLGSRLLRGSTAILTFGVNDAQDGGTGGNFTATASAAYLDSPATTSATTYKTQINSSQNSAQARVCDGGAVSTIVLMEVGA